MEVKVKCNKCKKENIKTIDWGWMP
jgi:hypothetical protein